MERKLDLRIRHKCYGAGQDAGAQAENHKEATMKFELYQDARQEWRWRLIADNNVDVVADSGEGYKAKSDAVHGIDLVRAVNGSTVVYERKPDGSWFKR